tara:strand:- start:787 stop:897 length:111 start_codon:yes stop_codon:yes gene_type:complete
MNKKFNNLKNAGSWMGVSTAIGVAIGAALGWKKAKK